MHPSGTTDRFPLPGQYGDTHMKEEITPQSAGAAARSTPVPSELESLRVNTAGDSATGAADRGASANQPTEWLGGHKEFAVFVHEYLQEFIKFADQKAGFIFAIASAILTFLVKQQVQRNVLASISNRGLSEWAGFLALLLMATADVLSLLVVLPRLRGKGTGLVYWKGILDAKGPSDYVLRIRRLGDDGLNTAVLEHCYELAGIADRKYELLKWAMWSGAFGAIAAGCVLLGL